MKKRYVVDASVVAKWYFPEQYSERAEHLLVRDVRLLAPAALYIEIGSLTLERVRRQEIDADTADRVMNALRQAPLELRRAAELVPAALPLALQTRLSLFEGLYLALAVEAGCPLVTADRAFHDALAGGPLAEHVLWIEELE